MIKKIITLIILILFTTASSGVVVFAFECNKYEHLHFSITQKVSCADFEDEHNTHILNTGTCCCDNFPNELNENLNHCCNENPNNNINIDNECGVSLVKTLSLNVDIELTKHIAKLDISAIKFPDFISINNLINPILLEQNTYKNKLPQIPTFSLIIVNYIQTIASVSADELPNIC